MKNGMTKSQRKQLKKEHREDIKTELKEACFYTPPHMIYAFEKTGIILSVAGYEEWAKELQKFNAAVAEYHAKAAAGLRPHIKILHHYRDYFDKFDEEDI